jgi:hypothetical protein
MTPKPPFQAGFSLPIRLVSDAPEPGFARRLVGLQNGRIVANEGARAAGGIG